MKKVAELGQLIEVPDSYKECSVCGKFNPMESFSNDGSTKMTRTNCQSCYTLSSQEWENLKSIKQNSKLSQEAQDYFKLNSLKSNSMKVEDLINELLKLPKDSLVLITQDGYYACGDYAEIFNPKKVDQVGEVSIYSIGNSSQNY